MQYFFLHFTTIIAFEEITVWCNSPLILRSRYATSLCYLKSVEVVYFPLYDFISQANT